MSLDPWEPADKNALDAAFHRVIRFKLLSGRDVTVRGFRYAGTYAGLLEGLPNKAINTMIIEEVMRTEQGRADRPPLLLTPELRAGYRNSVWLPPLCCIARLESSPMNGIMCGSSLTVIWFSGRFFDSPLSEVIPAVLRSIDWEKHATDFDV